MTWEDETKREAAERSEYVKTWAARPGCLGCGDTNHQKDLVAWHLTWRKQWGDTDIVRVEFENDIRLCPRCSDALKANRRTFWLLRYSGGVALAIGLCGLITCPTLLLLMKLNPEERASVWIWFAFTAPMLPAGILALKIAARQSVPLVLAPIATDGWECWRTTRK